MIPILPRIESLRSNMVTSKVSYSAMGSTKDFHYTKNRGGTCDPNDDVKGRVILHLILKNASCTHATENQSSLIHRRNSSFDKDLPSPT